LNSCEVDNLANEHPEIVRQMKIRLLDWHNALPGQEFVPENGGSFEYPWPGRE